MFEGETPQRVWAVEGKGTGYAVDRDSKTGSKQKQVKRTLSLIKHNTKYVQIIREETYLEQQTNNTLSNIDGDQTGLLSRKWLTRFYNKLQVRQPSQATKSGNQVRQPSQATKSGKQVTQPSHVNKSGNQVR